ncbi:MAG: anaerobic ribonucleoside-triphosphate reductase activating protein [Bacilli bacterium]|nr:anaerobic ribonucleoside-triphosphate reductase activating protein [Bacilli bacterium]
MTNDVVNGEGVCVSFWVQGCPHQCPGCFNPETWDFKEGQPYTEHTKWEIIEDIGANGIKRNFSILGGEPLDDRNLAMVEEVVTAVRQAYPNIKIFLWTGYTIEDLSAVFNNKLSHILKTIDVLIDGPFIEAEKDLSLKLRGSKNQRIFNKVNGKFEELKVS